MHVRSGITLGTGLGSAFIDDGEIVRTGARVPPGGELYTRRFRDAPVEETISRAALLARYGVRADEGIDVEQIAQRALAGEPAARRVFARPRERTRAVPHPVAACVQPDLSRGRRLDRTLLAALREVAARRAGRAAGARRPSASPTSSTMRRCSGPRTRPRCGADGRGHGCSRRSRRTSASGGPPVCARYTSSPSPRPARRRRAETAPADREPVARGRRSHDPRAGG